MVFDPAVIGNEGEPETVAWTATQCILYALGVGAGTSDLKFTTENTQGVPQQALPTTCLTLRGLANPYDLVGNMDMAKAVHAEQSIEIHKEFPTAGEAVLRNKVIGLDDKQTAALAHFERRAVEIGTGEPIFTTRWSMYVRDAGGWGGDRGAKRAWERPDRQADHAQTYSVGADQALLYRLTGDRNPLHSDPEFAKRAGFERPILHGLCTYGYAGRALLDACCDGDPTRFKQMYARFTKPVFPGDTLHVEIWRKSDTSSVFTVKVDSNTEVLSGGEFHHL